MLMELPGAGDGLGMMRPVLPALAAHRGETKGVSDSGEYTSMAPQAAIALLDWPERV
jgi:hypothetical protein